MRALSKISRVIGIVAVVALTASAADARQVHTRSFGGAHASVRGPQAPGSIPYDAGGAPFPTGHGGTTNSVDFQLVR